MVKGHTRQEPQNESVIVLVLGISGEFCCSILKQQSVMISNVKMNRNFYQKQTLEP